MTYGELPLEPACNVVLRCEACDIDYSANRGDYFLELDFEAICPHCLEELRLMRRQRVYRRVTRQECRAE